MKLLNIIVVIALIAPAVLAQQPSRTPGTPGTLGTLTLRGVVVTSIDVPLARVRVTVPVAVPLKLAEFGDSPEPARGVMTDDRGQFTIQVPNAGSTRLAFTKARYVTQTADISPRELSASGSEIRVRM